jgi:hypothetical protein
MYYANNMSDCETSLTEATSCEPTCDTACSWGDSSCEESIVDILDQGQETLKYFYNKLAAVRDENTKDNVMTNVFTLGTGEKMNTYKVYGFPNNRQLMVTMKPKVDKRPYGHGVILARTGSDDDEYYHVVSPPLPMTTHYQVKNIDENLAILNTPLNDPTIATVPYNPGTVYTLYTTFPKSIKGYTIVNISDDVHPNISGWDSTWGEKGTVLSYADLFVQLIEKTDLRYADNLPYVLMSQDVDENGNVVAVHSRQSFTEYFRPRVFDHPNGGIRLQMQNFNIRTYIRFLITREGKLSFLPVMDNEITRNVQVEQGEVVDPVVFVSQRLINVASTGHSTVRSLLAADMALPKETRKYANGIILYRQNPKGGYHPTFCDIIDLRDRLVDYGTTERRQLVTDKQASRFMTIDDAQEYSMDKTTKLTRVPKRRTNAK